MTLFYVYPGDCSLGFISILGRAERNEWRKGISDYTIANFIDGK
jgi:hypothetical protein